MPASSSTRLLDRLSVGWKISLIPLLFLLATGGLLAYTITTAEDQMRDAVTIDVAGKQRSLVRSYLSQVLLEARGADADPAAIAEHLLTSQTVLLDGGSKQFLNSGETVTVEAAPTTAIRQMLLETTKAIQTLRTSGEEFLALPADDPNADAVLQRLVENADAVEREANKVVKAYSEYSQEKIARMIRWELVLALSVAVVGGLISWWIARGIVGPLGRVVESAQQIAEGDLTGRPLAMSGNGEVGRLANVFDRMMAVLKDVTQQIRSATEDVNSASAEILASTQQQAAGTKEQAATVQEITSTMQEISRSGRQIIEKAKEISTSAEASATASQSGIQAVRATTRTMEAIREQVEEVAENIVSLSEKTQAVGEIIATVNDIAEQSNLLALNASIEAADAGADGNRFSVVASEMKQLADQAKECTVQVRTILGDIQKGINTSVMLTEEAVKRVESGRHQADTSEQTIHEMNSTTESSVSAFEQIIAAANQQQIGFEQVTQGMQDIRQAAEQTAQGTSQLEAAVANLGAMSSQLRSTVGRYRMDS